MSIISIVIPVYKVEHCISKCIESIITQSYNDWELVLVDDGSPDKSGEICDKYAQKDPRIKVFHIENGGPSNARNIGLDNAIGEFVCFIDSDDWVEPTYIEHLYNGLSKNGVGVVVAGHVRDCGENHLTKSVGDYFYEKDTMKTMFKDRNISHWGYTVAKLYRKDVILEHNICFPIKVKFSEDLAFFLDYLRYVDWVKFIPEIDYHYIIPESGGSLIVSYNSFESEYEGYKLCNKYFHDLARITDASAEEMNTSYEWMSYMFMRAIKTIYRRGKNYVHHKNRLEILASISMDDIAFANNYKSQGLFIDKWALYLLNKRYLASADALLTLFYKLRYI